MTTKSDSIEEIAKKLIKENPEDAGEIDLIFQDPYVQDALSRYGDLRAKQELEWLLDTGIVYDLPIKEDEIQVVWAKAYNAASSGWRDFIKERLKALKR